MPGKNTVKCYVAGGFYHVYNRGVAKQPVFCDDRDYSMMSHYISRHLGAGAVVDKLGRPYKKLNNQVKLHAFCLMPTHYHFLVEQLTDNGMEQFIRHIMTAYSMYFNWRHDRVGGLFQGPYKARLVTEDADLLGISRYIHENPDEVWAGKDLCTYPYSSLQFYAGQTPPDWQTTDYIMGILGGPLGYLELLQSLQGHTLQGVTL